MINTYKHIARGLGILLLAFSTLGLAGTDGALPTEQEFQVVDVVFTGLERTSPAWIRAYSDMDVPAKLTKDDAELLVRKLMTTGVFADVKAVYEPMPGQPDQYVLHVQVDEKWTTIPVIRGAFGGGTPLKVLGAYDTHAFGRLVTLGTEARQYGDAPPSLVVYARDPRAAGNRYYLGLEFWRDFRRRRIFTRGGDELGTACTNAATTRLKFLAPIPFEANVDEEVRSSRRVWPWKWGADLELAREASTDFSSEEFAVETPPDDLAFNDEPRQTVRILPALVYDDLEVFNLNLDGVRVKTRGGPLFSEGRPQGGGDSEAYIYELLPHDLNLAFHAFGGMATYKTQQGTFFLGGLDSIRGLPDGAIYGTHAAYANAEARLLTHKWQYVWLQNIVFVDGGAAGPSWDEAFRDTRGSAGIGVRFAVPRIYRLALRFDFAWSIDGSGTKGVALGFNQFFDPYTPL